MRVRFEVTARDIREGVKYDASACPIVMLCGVLSAGCTSETQYGRCLGLDDEVQKDPKLIYEVDVGNVIVGVVFVQTIVVPIWVALKEFYCPVGVKG